MEIRRSQMSNAIVNQQQGIEGRWPGVVVGTGQINLFTGNFTFHFASLQQSGMRESSSGPAI